MTGRVDGMKEFCVLVYLNDGEMSMMIRFGKELLMGGQVENLSSRWGTMNLKVSQIVRKV